MADSTKTIMPLGAAAQADNDPHRLDHIRQDQYDKTISARMSAAEIKATGLVVGAIAAGVFFLLWLLSGVSCWGQGYTLTSGCQIANGLFWGYVIGGVLLAATSAVVLLWGRIARVRVETARAAITRDRYSNPVSVMRVHEQSFAAGAKYFLAAQQAEIAMAPYKMLPAGLDVFNQAAQPAASAPAQLTVLPDAPALVSDTEWLGWVDRTPHLMIAGRTEAGKTTLAEAVIAQRASAGELLYVLDPHYQPGKWCGLPAIGGGRGYTDVMSALGLVMEELDRRYIDYGRGKKTEEFERLTVFIDEVPALVEWCFDGKTMRDKRWLSFAKHLGSEARKVRIAVILMTQSPLVQDILINTRMRENFTRIALGDQSGELVSEAREPRRKQLEQLIAGQQYTAAMEYRNVIHVLDTSNVKQLANAAARVNVETLGWQPPRPREIEQAPGAVVYPAWARSTNGRIAFLLSQHWTYRQIEQELSVSHQTISQVSKALQARGK